MAKIENTHNDLMQNLTEQISFLFSSCAAFDNGHHFEAKRISTALRILLKDGDKPSSQVKSLLGQLNRKNNFPSYHSLERNDSNAYPNFIVDKLHGNHLHSYVPRFVYFKDEPIIMSFDNWYNEIIITAFDGKLFSRKDIIITVCEMDGGAHVDKSVEENYYRLIKLNSQKTFEMLSDIDDNGKSIFPKIINPQDLHSPMPPVWHSLRQMAHEVLETLIEKPIAYGYDVRAVYRGLATGAMIVS